MQNGSVREGIPVEFFGQLKKCVDFTLFLKYKLLSIPIFDYLYHICQIIYTK